jgi:hypothetical protein
LAYLIRKTSVQQDFDPDPAVYRKSVSYSALFIVFFAVTNSTSGWDWLMSIDAHWYSTIYAWYVFSGMLVTALTGIILLLIVLQKAGYLKEVNENHYHDLGKYLFAFSIFWMYLWFSQYLLIWYSNIPEETVYFMARLHDFPVLFYLNLVLCFLFPFLFLMTDTSKKKKTTMAIASVVVLIGHWIDFYLMIMPGTVGKNAGIGMLEVGTFIAFTGMFLFVVFRQLSRYPLISAKHPLYSESLTYDS